MLEFTVYPGRDNKVRLVLYDNGVPLPDHTAITRAIFYVGSTAFDSTDNPSLVDLTNANRIEFDPASATPEIAAGKYEGKLVIYDAVNYLNGYVWPIDFMITVKPEPGAV